MTEDEKPGAAGADGPSGAGPGCAGFYTARDRKNQRRFNLWVFAAMFAYLGAAAALRWRAAVPGLLPGVLTVLASILAILATRSYLVFLRQADELLRRIQTEALALGFGVGAVFALLYPLFEKLGAPRLGGNATALVLMLAWAVGTWLSTRRYCAGGGAS